MTDNVKANKIYYVQSHLLAFLQNYLAEILLAEPSDCHDQTSNQIEPVHLFLSLTTLLP
jgi:hypothetical protein